MKAFSEEKIDHETAIAVSSVMSRSVTGIRLPPDLLDRAVRENRRRAVRRRLLAGASVLAAAATAAAVVLTLPVETPAGGAPQGPPAAAPRLQAAAYVLVRATQAQANTRTMISETRAANGTTYTDLATQQQRYDAGIRASNGQPYFSWADTVKNGTWTETMVVNQNRVYSVQTASSSQGLGIGTILPLQGQSDPVAAYNTALKQGHVTVIGHQDLNGRDTILLRYSWGNWCGAASASVCEQKLKYLGIKGNVTITGQQPYDEVWIDASTYLVVQIKSYTPTGNSFVTTVSWLPATPGNLALLSVTPPAGYARVPYTDMGKYLGPVS